ncbi:hypothetical protein [Mycobacterium lacus]|uniref:Uncharacterized protein n=1 Tax=Mycobacterium lacus TaxID=169765 RepID=A0A1X1Y138_9MYCO|nr:hypothetical protein [Mycobacterium lacus]MCV7123302.1 hypothetical protein [Mycobacterium lacus]ORW04714.1 hypothetical protein AWC15_02920 [Mycobacterium lacus]BBX97079.1 hypothetical protein MLAC_23730 [Mycobacterium lacus]
MSGHPDVEVPAGTTRITGRDGGARVFDGREWTVESASEGHDITVSIHGMQCADGRVVSRVAVGGLCPDWPITSQRARRLARALIAAADAAEGPEYMQP